MARLKHRNAGVIGPSRCLRLIFVEVGRALIYEYPTVTKLYRELLTYLSYVDTRSKFELWRDYVILSGMLALYNF